MIFPERKQLNKILLQVAPGGGASAGTPLALTTPTTPLVVPSAANQPQSTGTTKPKRNTITVNQTTIGSSGGGGYNETAAGGAQDDTGANGTGSGSLTPGKLDPPLDVIWGWNWREMLPNAALSQLTTFLCLWAVEVDYGQQTFDADNKRSAGYWKNLVNTGYKLNSQILEPIDYGNGVKDYPRIWPINKDYQCKIDGVPVKYINVLPNIAQVLTKDAKGGVGIDNISLNKPFSNSFTIELNLMISNVYELMEQESFWRFMVHGQRFILTVGWQDSSNQLYTSAYDNTVNGKYRYAEQEEIAKELKKSNFFGNRSVIPPIINPASGMLHPYFWDINTQSNEYLNPAHGFWTSYVMDLSTPSFSIEGTGVRGSCKFFTPGQLADDMFVKGTLGGGATKVFNDDADNAAAKTVIQKSDFDPETGQYKKDAIKTEIVQSIRLGDALKSVIAARNEFIYRDGMDQMWYQNKLIFFSEQVKVGEPCLAPMVTKPGVQGLCNFSLGAGMHKIKEKFFTAEGHDLLKDATYESGEEKNVNKQQAEDKQAKADLKRIDKIGDIPIKKEEFEEFNKLQRKSNFTVYMNNFLNSFLQKQFGSVLKFHFTSDKNTYSLYLMDEHMNKTNILGKSKLGDKQILGSLEFREWLLNVHRWRYFVLRYGDQQSLVKHVSMNALDQDHTSASIDAALAASQVYANAGTAAAGQKDAISEVFAGGFPEGGRREEDRNQSTNKSPVIKPDVPNDQANIPSNSSQANVAEGNTESQGGQTNTAKSAVQARADVYKTLLALGVKGQYLEYSIGTYIKAAFQKLQCTIHGTFGLFEGMTVYFVGLFEWLRGYYIITEIQHTLTTTSFETSFTLTWHGNDAGRPDQEIDGRQKINMADTTIAAGGATGGTPTEGGDGTPTGSGSKPQVVPVNRGQKASAPGSTPQTTTSTTT